MIRSAGTALLYAIAMLIVPIGVLAFMWAVAETIEVFTPPPSANKECCWCCGIGNAPWCVNDPWVKDKDAACRAEQKP